MPDKSKKAMAWAKGKSITPNESIFTQNGYTSSFVKTRIIKDKLIDHKCCECGITDTWMNKKLTLELDHINGNSNDNRLENLRFMCPNCHSQTSTHKGRNINNGRIKVSDEELLTAYKSCSNIRQALIKVGLVPKGGNYQRMYRLALGDVVQRQETSDLKSLQCRFESDHPHQTS